jgi:hypothetical protein
VTQLWSAVFGTALELAATGVTQLWSAVFGTALDLAVQSTAACRFNPKRRPHRTPKAHRGVQVQSKAVPPTALQKTARF